MRDDSRRRKRRRDDDDEEEERLRLAKEAQKERLSRCSRDLGQREDDLIGQREDD